VGVHEDRHFLPFSELKAKAVREKADKGLNLVRVKYSRNREEFKFLSNIELETAVRKARRKKQNVLHEVVGLNAGGDDGGDKLTRMREKQLVISANARQHDLEIAANRIVKWLRKDRIVNVTVKKHGNSDAQKVAEKIGEKCVQELGEDLKKDFLTFKIGD